MGVRSGGKGIRHICTPNSRKCLSMDVYFTAWQTRPTVFYPHDAMLARVFARATCPSVRPYVRLSVTRRYYVKTKKASVVISSPFGVTVGPARSFARPFSCIAIDLRSIVFRDVDCWFTVCVSCRGLVVGPAR